MALILKKAWNGYIFLFHDIVDPRTQTWPLAAKPYQGLALLAIYLMFVLKWGPQWMKHRQPYNLDKLLIAYNAFQVIACVFLFNKSIVEAWGWKYKWICEPVDFSNSPSGLEIARVVYYYYLLKIFDLLDTVFFVLRKKNNQISFLHIYHHTGMVVLIWAAVTYYPGGHGTLIGVINTFVHIVMYSYYLLTVATPSIRNAIWIKKLVTQLQILQFFWCVMHMAVIVFKSDCEYPRWISAVFLPQNLFMLVLFVDFYIKAYVKKPKQIQQVQNNVKLNNNIENNNVHKNGIDRMKTAEVERNKINKLNEINNIKNNLYKQANYNDFNNYEYDVNFNIYENGNGKLSCANGKSRSYDHDKQD